MPLNFTAAWRAVAARPTPWWVVLLVAVPIVGALAWWLRRRWLAVQAAERRRSAYEKCH